MTDGKANMNGWTKDYAPTNVRIRNGKWQALIKEFDHCGQACVSRVFETEHEADIAASGLQGAIKTLKIKNQLTHMDMRAVKRGQKVFMIREAN